MGEFGFSPKKKERKKVVRTILQIITLIFIAYFIILALFTTKKYVPFEESNRRQIEDGFIAISYFGVDRLGTETLINKKRLKQHIEALKKSGYVTITQQDIKDYYVNKKPLPRKSVFLIFEDGRRDTAIFSHKVLEKYNYKASILSYAQNLQLKTSKFLSPSDLIALKESSFWELGTNGYRLSYINAFDRHNNFFDQLDTNQFQMVSSYLDRNYNHYLMDYIRDEYNIPVEDFYEMRNRINYDYNMMEEVYKDTLGTMPTMYAIMHSNTGQFGTNDNASSVNEENIYKLFDINFNREGNSKNTLNDNIYNLTRMQPQAYWSTNHLLMRIWDDTGKQMAFVSGDMERKKDWHTVLGESEFIEDTIILTSLPRDKGLMFLKDNENYKDIDISVLLKGNKKGSQSIYFRSDKDLNKYISVQIEDNILYVNEKEQGGQEQELFSLDLDIHDNISIKSMDEDELESKIKYIESKIKNADNKVEEKKLKALLKEKKEIEAKKVEEGAEEYIPRIDIIRQGNRLVNIKVEGNKLSVNIDNKEVFKDLQISILDGGYIGLESYFSGYGYSQRNIADPVYDGVFEKLVVRNILKDESTNNKKSIKNSHNDKTGEILYSNELTGIEKYKHTIKLVWENVTQWFVKHL